MIMIKQIIKQAISLFMIFALIFCSFPTDTLANSTGKEITLTLSDSAMSGCDCSFDVDITIETGTFQNQISKLYLVAIDDDDKVILKNGRSKNIANNVLLTINGENSYKILKNGGTVDLDETAKATLTQLTEKGITSQATIDLNASGYYFLCYYPAKYGFVVQVKGSSAPLNYSALNAQLARIEDETGSLDRGIYYIENDCFNGKVYTTGGAWAALTKANGPYDKAKGTFTLQSEIDKAASDLSAAIDKLIPITLANPTLLYNQLQKKWKYGYGYGIQEWGVPKQQPL